MKNQRTNTQIRSRGFLSFAIVLVMLATLLCCFTVMTSAAGTQLSVDREDLDLSGLQTDASKLYYKVYDGTTAANVQLSATKAELGIAASDDVQVNVSAAFNSKNVADANRITVSFTLTGADAGKYIAPAPLYIDATIKPIVLDWAADGTAATVFESGKTTYKDLAVQVPALKLAGIVAGDTVSASTDKLSGLGIDYIRVQLGDRLSLGYGISAGKHKHIQLSCAIDSLFYLRNRHRLLAVIDHYSLRACRLKSFGEYIRHSSSGTKGIHIWR